MLPSATEIVFALGLGDDLVGVTDECDAPAEARRLPVVSRSSLPSGGAAADVDRAVAERVADGEPLYRLDTDLIRSLRPDLILAQDLCRVCAVPSGMVTEALDRIGCEAAVVSLDPARLDEVLDGMLDVGHQAGATARASAVVAGLRERLERTRAATAGLARPRTLALEWSDPPFAGGHWVPDMVAAAGGTPILVAGGEPSRRVGWDEVAAARPEVLVFMPCGYHLDQAVAEGRALLGGDGRPGRAELEGVASAWAVDASSFFSRPGPRLVDGVEVLAGALHPGSVPGAGAGVISRLR